MFKRLLGALLVLLAGSGAFAAEGGWVALFDGKTLSGWKASENPASFRVEDGAIVANGPRAHLFYMGADGKADFKNFELTAEARTEGAANSGIYFHTAYQEKGYPAKGEEIQVNNTDRSQEGGYVEHKKTGSLYGVRCQYKPLVNDGEWFKLHALVEGKRVRIWVNDIMTVDFLEPTSYTSTHRPGRKIDHGTFALQGHDEKSKVSFRNIQVRRLPDDLPQHLVPAPMDEVDKQISELQMGNFPVIDFHVHLKGGLMIEEAMARSRRVGVGYGVAVNCGLGFSITNDQQLGDFIDSMKGQACFLGMQAEGREWTRLFSPVAIAKFDYVFTDGMTLFDAQGRRSRLWIKGEYEIGDKQAFMDHLVKNIVTIINNEPIDIYVNPTFIPAELQPEYDQLWTPARMQQVVDALAKNGVALEINNRYKIPGPAFLKLAKSAGVKFTFGTNNTDGNFERPLYALEMTRELGLTWKDMWMPKPDGKKPIQVRGVKK